MSPTPRFKLVADDLAKKINPTGAPGYFAVGAGPGQVPEAVINVELKGQEARVCSSIPEKWGKMLDRFEGLIALRWADAGQTVIVLPFAPTGDVQVFKNYPSNFGNGMKVFGGSNWPGKYPYQKPYSSRTADDSMESSEYTIETAEESGVTSLTLAAALEAGDHVIMDFNHDSMQNCDELRMCVLELAAAEILRGYPTMSENVGDKISAWEMNAQMFLKRLWNAEGGYRTGVQFFDRIKLAPELETRISGGTRAVSPGYGALL